MNEPCVSLSFVVLIGKNLSRGEQTRRKYGLCANPARWGKRLEIYSGYICKGVGMNNKKQYNYHVLSAYSTR